MLSEKACCNFLTNDGKEFSKGFISDLQWLKKLRNEIEHHKFALNLEEVKEAVGRLIAAINEFDVQHADLKLGNLVDPVNVGTFDELAKTYRLQLQNATKAVEAAEKDAYKGLRHKEWGDVRFQIFTCPECDHDTLIPNGSSDTGYRCTFCENEESDEIEVSCGVCDSEWPSGEMLFEDFHGFGLKIFVCPRCSGDPDYRND